MSKLSVTILTYNEERRIAECIESVRAIADEIIVVDSLSTDRTVEICRNYGCRISHRPFGGYGAMRQYATSLTTNDYVLSIDADEVVSEEMRNSIARLKREGFTHRVYSVNRLNFYCGTPVRHCGWYPDVQIRLFDKRYANWNLRDISERVIFRDSVNPEPIAGDLLHYQCMTPDEYRDTQTRHAVIKSRVLAVNNPGITPLTPVLRAIRAFVVTYMQLGGWLDGAVGRNISYERFRAERQAYRLARAIQRGTESQQLATGSSEAGDENNPVSV